MSDSSEIPASADQRSNEEPTSTAKPDDPRVESNAPDSAAPGPNTDQDSSDRQEQRPESVCPACGETVASDAKFCEACGYDLATEPMPVCVACGALAVGAEGYCEVCGHKQPAERDHMEVVSGSISAVTDRGLRHRHNEDAVAIGERDGVMTLVVCDGVSSTAGSAEASLGAALAARDLLVGLVKPASSEPDVAAALIEAASVAQAEASATVAGTDNAPHVGDGPPSATFVAAVVQPTTVGHRISVGWLGDSRAYWLDENPRQLTVDHEIQGALTRWLGADSVDVTPDIKQIDVETGGHLVVCSDGLWRYANSAGEMRARVGEFLNGGKQGLPLAAALVAFANKGGGHDNISVALWAPPTTMEQTDDDV